MEKIIFFGLVIPIIGFVLYLGATAIMKGFSAKEENRSEKEAKGFRQVQTTDPTDVMGMEPQSEEKHLASGLFK